MFQNLLRLLMKFDLALSLDVIKTKGQEHSTLPRTTIEEGISVEHVDQAPYSQNTQSGREQHPCCYFGIFIAEQW